MAQQNETQGRMSRIIKNAGWIIGCKIAKAVLTLAVTMITARFLGVSNYGLINYAAGLVAFVAPVMKLGLDAIAVHEIVDRPDREGETLGSILVMCTASSILCILGVFAFTCIANADEPVTKVVCLLYSVVLIFQAMEMVQYWFQAKLLSKFSALAMLTSYILVSVVQITMLIMRADIRWFALSYSIDYSIIAVILLAVYKKKGTQGLSFSAARSKAMLNVSKYYILSGLMITIFNNTDRIMLKLMVSDAATGIYAAAHVCASMTSFVFVAIIDSMRSTIFESKKISDTAYEKNIVRLYSVIIYFSLLQCVVITALAPFIIRIMYGEAYMDSTAVLRIAIWFSTFSYLGTVRDIWILSEGYQRYLWQINLSGAVMNVVLNYLLIPLWGPAGAAVASVVSQFFTNVVTGYIIRDIRHCNALMTEGLKLSVLAELIRTIFRKRGQ